MALQGSWNMTEAGSPYQRTGRYLGIGDGYFLYRESPNWVYCYCKSCWQKAILNLSFTISQPHNTLQQQIIFSQQQLTTLEQQLDTSRAESAFYKKQLDELNEIYNKLSNGSGIEKLRDLFKQLSTSQINALHTHTKFRVDTFEPVYGEQHMQCLTQFVQSTLTQLKSSIDAVLQLQKIKLTQRKQAKEKLIQTLTTSGVPNDIIDASIKPLETEIEQTQTDIDGWNTFLTVLINNMNQSNVTESFTAKNYIYLNVNKFLLVTIEFFKYNHALRRIMSFFSFYHLLPVLLIFSALIIYLFKIHLNLEVKY